MREIIRFNERGKSYSRSIIGIISEDVYFANGNAFERETEICFSGKKIITYTFLSTDHNQESQQVPLVA